MANHALYHDGSLGTPEIAEAIERAVKPRQRSPIYWLIASGIVLVAAIVLGTALAINNFRDRALTNSKRELENTLQLLARHFDQQLQDWQVIQEDVVTQAARSKSNRPRIFCARSPARIFTGISPRRFARCRMSARLIFSARMVS